MTWAATPTGPVSLNPASSGAGRAETPSDPEAAETPASSLRYARNATTDTANSRTLSIAAPRRSE